MLFADPILQTSANLAAGNKTSSKDCLSRGGDERKLSEDGTSTATKRPKLDTEAYQSVVVGRSKVYRTLAGEALRRDGVETGADQLRACLTPRGAHQPRSLRDRARVDTTRGPRPHLVERRSRIV